MEPISFFAYGIPKAQPRPRAFARWGRASVYNPKTADEWKADVRLAGSKVRPSYPIAEPIMVSMLFFMPRPKKIIDKDLVGNQIWHQSKPDIDNLIKAVLDAMVDDDWFVDDSIVVSVLATKRYSTNRSPSITGVQVDVIEADHAQEVDEEDEEDE